MCVRRLLELDQSKHVKQCSCIKAGMAKLCTSVCFVPVHSDRATFDFCFQLTQFMIVFINVLNQLYSVTHLSTLHVFAHADRMYSDDHTSGRVFAYLHSQNAITWCPRLHSDSRLRAFRSTGSSIFGHSFSPNRRTVKSISSLYEGSAML